MSPSVGDARVVHIDTLTDPRWDDFVAGHEDGVIFHHSTWLAALASEYDVAPFGLAVEARDGRLLGVLPLCYTRGFPLRRGGSVAGRRLASLPRTPIAGPLAVDRETSRRLIQAAIELLRNDGGISLQIKVLGRRLDEVVDHLVAEPWRPNYRVQLKADPGELRFGSSRNHASIMRAVRKSERLGVQLRVAETETELRAWYDLYLDAMRAAPALARPYRLFASMWETMRPHGYAELLIAERHEGGRRTMLAGSFLLRYGPTVFFGFNGRRLDQLQLRPNEAIHWRAIQDACRSGYRWYDLGEADEGSGLAAFKSKWASEVATLHRYYFPEPRLRERLNEGRRGASTAKSVWRKLPNSATAALSDRIYRYL